MTQRFAQAASGTAETEKQVEQAIRALDGFRDRTGRNLIETRDSIAAALKAMSDTPWPTSADYDAAETEGH